MYVRGSDRAQVQKWVDTVHSLRYKDYQLVAPVEIALGSEAGQEAQVDEARALKEVETVKEMGSYMEAMGIQKWWRTAMGFVHG